MDLIKAKNFFDEYQFPFGKFKGYSLKGIEERQFNYLSFIADGNRSKYFGRIDEALFYRTKKICDKYLEYRMITVFNECFGEMKFKCFGSKYKKEINAPVILKHAVVSNFDFDGYCVKFYKQYINNKTGMYSYPNQRVKTFMEKTKVWSAFYLVRWTTKRNLLLEKFKEPVKEIEDLQFPVQVNVIGELPW